MYKGICFLISIIVTGAKENQSIQILFKNLLPELLVENDFPGAAVFQILTELLGAAIGVTTGAQSSRARLAFYSSWESEWAVS